MYIVHMSTPNFMARIFNHRHAFTARVTVLGLCVYLSALILALQPMRRIMGNTNSFSTTSARKINGDLLKRRHSRARNWHCRGPHCMTQPINELCTHAVMHVCVHTHPGPALSPYPPTAYLSLCSTHRNTA